MQYSAIATVLMLATLVLSISACSQQEFAEIIDHRSKVFTKNGIQQDASPVSSDIAYKYQSDDPDFGVPAEVEVVQQQPIDQLGQGQDQLGQLPDQDIAEIRDGRISAEVGGQSGFQSQSSQIQTAGRSSIEPVKTEAQTLNQGFDPNKDDEIGLIEEVKAPSQPFKWPVKGEITSGYGELRNGQLQEGIVIRAARGTPIRAASGGEVAYVGTALEEFGTIAIIRHNNGFMSSYGHADEILVGKGQFVNQGEVIGYVGETGTASEPQLHFTIRSGKRTVDPRSYLPN